MSVPFIIYSILYFICMKIKKKYVNKSFNFRISFIDRFFTVIIKTFGLIDYMIVITIYNLYILFINVLVLYLYTYY